MAEQEILIFTLCSNNYLAHAVTLGNSIVENVPNSRFIIGLVDDKHPDVNYEYRADFKIIEYSELGLKDIARMQSMYDIVEFNTALKPYYFEYLMNMCPDALQYYYIDPDILLVNNLDESVELLNEGSVILTPMLTEANEEPTIDELVALRHGHYNLGFIGVRKTKEAIQFLKWWQNRLRSHCVINKAKGLFVDQKWVDLIMILFNEIVVIKNKGYNMSWWNLSERKLLTDEKRFYVNSKRQPLIFYHFSGFKPDAEDYFGRPRDNQYTFQMRPDLISIHRKYASLLYNNGYRDFANIPPMIRLRIDKTTKIDRLKKIVKKIISKVISSVTPLKNRIIYSNLGDVKN